MSRSAIRARVTKNAEKVSISRIMKASLLKANKQFQIFSEDLKQTLQKELQEVLEKLYAHFEMKLQLQDEQNQV